LFPAQQGWTIALDQRIHGRADLVGQFLHVRNQGRWNAAAGPGKARLNGETGDLPPHVLEQTTDAGRRVDHRQNHIAEYRARTHPGLELLLQLVERAHVLCDPFRLAPASPVRPGLQINVDRFPENRRRTRYCIQIAVEIAFDRPRNYGPLCRLHLSFHNDFSCMK
jgi:hypothetical protein